MVHTFQEEVLYQCKNLPGLCLSQIKKLPSSPLFSQAIKEADEYFASRPRDSQLGAWASAQSQPLPYTGALVKNIAEMATKFLGRDVPRPPHWGGFRIVPQSIEFWQQGNFRLHDRELFVREGQRWKVLKLYP